MALWLYVVCLSVSHAGEYQDKYDELTKDRKMGSKFVLSFVWLVAVHLLH